MNAHMNFSSDGINYWAKTLTSIRTK